MANRTAQLTFETVLALVLGGVFAFVVAVGPFVVADQDVAWHVETGRWIIAHWNVPRVDPFSWTAAGQPWIDNEWLAQVLMALTADRFGWRGLVALDGVLWAALVAFQEYYIRINLYGDDHGHTVLRRTYAASQQASQNTAKAEMPAMRLSGISLPWMGGRWSAIRRCVGTVLFARMPRDATKASEPIGDAFEPANLTGGLPTVYAGQFFIPLSLAVGVLWFASFHGQMRPHMFALVCLTVWTGELCRGHKHSFMSSVGLLALFVLWVQLHGSALVLGPFVALMLGHWRIALACMPLGLVNPYGWGYYEMVIWQQQHFALMQSHIAELRPVNAETDFWRVAVLGAFVFAALANGVRLPLARAALVFALAGAGMLAWRGLAFFAIVAAIAVVSAPWFRDQSLWLYWRAFTYRVRKTSRRRVPTDLTLQSIEQWRKDYQEKYITITTSGDT